MIWILRDLVVEELLFRRFGQDAIFKFDTFVQCQSPLSDCNNCIHVRVKSRVC